MNSKFFLSFSSQTLKDDYIKKRTRETLILSSIILLMRVLTIVGLIIYAAALHTPNIFSNHLIINLASLLWHLVVIILAKKCPSWMIYLHSPLVMLTFFF